MKTLAITLDWANAEAYGNVWTLPETEITSANAPVLKEQGDVAFDAIVSVPDDAIVTLIVGIDGEPAINYSAPKAEFLASEYNQVRLSKLTDGQAEQGISQEVADLIKQYIQSFVK